MVDRVSGKGFGSVSRETGSKGRTGGWSGLSVEDIEAMRHKGIDAEEWRELSRRERRFYRWLSVSRLEGLDEDGSYELWRERCEKRVVRRG